MKPRTGYIFRRWMGKHLPANSPIEAPFYCAVLGHTGAAMSDTYSRADAEAARKAVEKAVPLV